MGYNVTISDRLVPAVQYAAPTTGSTVTINSNGNVKLLLNPAGSLLALTIAFPASPSDGDMVTIGSTQAITTVTMSGGTIVAPLTTAVIGTSATFIYSATASSWVKTGA